MDDARDAYVEGLARTVGELAGRLECFTRAGDILAEMLGYAIAAGEGGEGFTVAQVDAARKGILCWHQLKRIVSE